MKKCLFIYNAYSGRGKIAQKEKKIVKLLNTKYQTTVCKTEHAGHLGEIIAQFGMDNDIIVVAGGDGTINEAVNAMARLSERKTLGIIPCGTVNDVAHSLNIPINVIKATKNILKGVTFAHDIFKMNDRFGIYVACAGLFKLCDKSVTKEKIRSTCLCLTWNKESFFYKSGQFKTQL